MKKVSFYDPLYDFVTFEEAAAGHRKSWFDKGFGSDTIRSPIADISAFLGTPELSRLSFMRQSDLAFLVFPSATHTRLAHAIGCCYLGYIAARGIMVGVTGEDIDDQGGRSDRLLQLSLWLEERDWKEEFLLALLLHDIGHFAFSHAVENNKELWLSLGMNVEHEEVTRQLVLGRGAFFDAFRQNWRGTEAVRHVSEIIQSEERIDERVICYLISANKEDLDAFDTRQQAELRMLHELTSGLLDLDRVDHYRRDSYFTGMKFASNLNFGPLIGGFSIWYDPHKPQPQHEVRLSASAIGHALALLHGKERLVQDCFENMDNLAYEVMLSQAINCAVFGDDFYAPGYALGEQRDRITRRVFELLLTTDDELLVALEGCGSKPKSIVARIRNRRPFSCLGKVTWRRRTEVPDVREMRLMILQRSAVQPDDVLLRFHKYYAGPRKLRPTEWLHLDSLNDEKGLPLEHHLEYKKQIEYFKRVQDEDTNTFWVFTPSEEAQTQQRIKKAVSELVRNP